MKQKKTWLAVLYSLRCLQNSMADAKFKLKIDGDAIRKRYSDKKKKARMMLKSEIVKDCAPFVPMLDGALKNSPIASISKDDDFIIYLSPYAHYQYYGVLYVDPMTGKGAFLILNMASGQDREFPKRTQDVHSIIQRHIILRHAPGGLKKEKIFTANNG